MYWPDKKTFMAMARPGRVIPVRREVIADLVTPLTAFLRLDRDPTSAAFLLESVEGGEKWGRYSFIGVQPKRLIRTRGACVETVDSQGNTTSQTVEDPLSHVCRESVRWKPIEDEELPRF